MENIIRKASVSGSFYPADPATLSDTIDRYLKNSVIESEGKPLAIVSPHAGYIFSGKIAADAFKRVSKHTYETIVVLGSNHTVQAFKGVAIYPGGFNTPLGDAIFCNETAKSLIEKDNDFVFNEEAHIREHSVEVQIPFIQRVFPDAKIVAAIIGTPDLDLCERFGRALSEISEKQSLLIVASSDLSHFPNYDNAIKVDTQTLESIASLKTEKFIDTIEDNRSKNIDSLATSACGEAPVLAAMIAAKISGATKGEVISYQNSGDTEMGDNDRVVGYGAVAFI
jgi:AmmeMemoRadiSam system protein B